MPPAPIRSGVSKLVFNVMSEVRIGTSGWHYGSWWGPFFPQDLKKKDALRYYGSQFSATELNAPFYRTPTLESVRAQEL